MTNTHRALASPNVFELTFGRRIFFLFSILKMVQLQMNVCAFVGVLLSSRFHMEICVCTQKAIIEIDGRDVRIALC